MTAEEYVLSVVRKYQQHAGVNSPAHKTANLLFSSIKSWAGDFLNEVHFSGSYAKGTGVKGSADLDLFISLKSDTPYTLQYIFDSLFDNYKNEIPSRRQNVSIGIKYNGLDIDLVPGKKQKGNTNYHSLYKSKTDTWTQTNVKNHIKIVSESGRCDEIRVMKIWRHINNLDFPSIFLELSVLEALKHSNKNQCATNVWKVFHYLKNDFLDKRIVDPSNTNNIISDDLNKQEKRKIVQLAEQALAKKYWSEIIW
ncbi:MULTISPECIES: nucleotidyltransferase [unclassified Paenibacillus]|uniref:nucleotidyltransferase domain-containing protein n=1 Tax=unclassified Paenibacillus TaxID=185978 RepID=UPI001AE7259D|nr:MULTISPECIES: nucleotidyltransferase [unclassified Paenibacillus]MBP1154641.1 hypothetical protein [Paenibacillus sp. PvP091]MBP1169975.1 hypothetical protein [Paenibacillus sp. PvR098]MBP2441003.1 hypothetical protein [Paenibacillus sp. PvP052]